jgi:cytidylate kinase
MSKHVDVIAIDGPAASGKSTVGRMLAEALDYLLLDTGFMYRAVTLAALRRGVDVADETAVARLAGEITIDVEAADDAEDGRLYTALLDGEDVTWQLRTPDVDAHVSRVSSYAGVRREMVRRQRQIGERGGVVMVGRDIGAVVMPQAPLKLYMVAAAEERARRRWQERRRQGHPADYDEILADVNRRDDVDSSREHSPLRPAQDAVIIDTTDSEPEEVVEEILRLSRKRAAVRRAHA